MKVTSETLASIDIDPRDKAEFWNRILISAKTEPREPIPIRGSSGLDHPILGIGVDDKRKRLILISEDHDARSAALMQADVQTAFDDKFNVIVLRPVLGNINKMAQQFLQIFGTTEIDLISLANEVNNARYEEDGKVGIRKDSIIHDAMMSLIGPFALGYKLAPINFVSQVFGVLQEISKISYSVSKLPDGNSNVVLGFNNVIDNDPIILDRKLGICPLPFYEIMEDDLDVIINRGLGDLVEFLRKIDVYQYFFPPVDHAILGIVERSSRNLEEVIDRVKIFPDIGHPLSEPELPSSSSDPLKVILDLQQAGLLTEGSIETEISDQGKAIRSTVSFKPREGVISKLINIIDLPKIIKVVIDSYMSSKHKDL